MEYVLKIELNCNFRGKLKYHKNKIFPFLFQFYKNIKK